MRGTSKPTHVRIPPSCCTGWYFEHTTECPSPRAARPCSDCGADPSSGHNPHTCSWYWSDDDTSAFIGMRPDAARWPGRAGDNQSEDY
ncbi:hypothetical protein FHR83_005399 [Actinoplanes campanulatus]|uniref:Uncharacterized protein n=1 Tax=Actinoplanes campanulatus TaxID=113559 RepID=A0A7W5AKF5_9ACTN|nr:hypothetical protein [Actinoplanes campanulatus]MBB3097715.1 hypothetical protein [Actinoplanes campanulatus]GGN37975.1 hypothetical protein GCM10010109_64370 [Actinoplanes campanulatus]GID39717.1 hypothetical protein Aca09nite_62230 [Actinoplanes campanulatus]